jgi:hypothetical protein
MPLLAYCLAEARDQISIPPCGVQGMAIQGLRAGNLWCFVSEFGAGNLEGGPSIKEAAIEFNRTLQEFLKQITIMPFRFPTVLGDKSELLEHVVQQSSHYEEVLKRLRGMVQMDIRVETPQAENARVSSGTEYLRTREARYKMPQDIAAQFRRAGEPWIREWRERDTSHGLHCSALLPHEHIDGFLLKTRAVTIAFGYTARVSGPWPPAEFLKENEQRKL